jgi:hypothetical protein
MSGCSFLAIMLYTCLTSSKQGTCPTHLIQYIRNIKRVLKRIQATICKIRVHVKTLAVRCQSKHAVRLAATASSTLLANGIMRFLAAVCVVGTIHEDEQQCSKRSFGTSQRWQFTERKVATISGQIACRSMLAWISTALANKPVDLSLPEYQQHLLTSL